MGIYNMDLFSKMERKTYSPEMQEEVRERKYQGWKEAVGNI